MNENANIKRQISKLEQERANSRSIDERRTTAPKSAQSMSEVSDAMQLKQMNTQLQKRIEFLQKREKDLMEHLLKVQKEKGN